MLVHLQIIIFTSVQPVAVADSVPKFDIARECQFEVGSSKDLQDKCAADEKQALEQLRKEWAQFSPSAKRQCIQEASMGDAPSYVELQTCLELERDATKASK
jgi:hypothetical protein